MNNDNTVIIAGVIVFILILLMLIAAFLLLKSHKSGGGKKKIKAKRRVVRKTGSKPASSRTHFEGGAGSAAKRSGAKPAKTTKGQAKPVPLKGPGDEGIEKYARMTEDYVRSKFMIELKRVDLKKYYSDRHGFECVDFTYRPASGVVPAMFRTHLNDVDTALSNVSGVDTITFAVDNTTGTYRTTFYLGS